MDLNMQPTPIVEAMMNLFLKRAKLMLEQKQHLKLTQM